MKRSVMGMVAGWGVGLMVSVVYGEEQFCWRLAPFVDELVVPNGQPLSAVLILKGPPMRHTPSTLRSIGITCLLALSHFLTRPQLLTRR
jgi:hypothetical protein